MKHENYACSCKAQSLCIHNATCLPSTQLLICQQSSLTSGVTHENSSFLGRLDHRLVVAANSVADRDKLEFALIKHVSMICSKLQESFCQLVVVLLLLDSVVESRVAQVLFAIGNKELFKLYKM